MKSCYFSRLGLIFTPRAIFRPALRRQALKALVLLLALALFVVLPGSAAAGDGALDLTFNPGAVQKIPSSGEQPITSTAIILQVEFS